MRYCAIAGKINGVATRKVFNKLEREGREALTIII